MKPSIKSKEKVKVKTKKLVLPVVASLFLFAIMLGVSLNGDLVPLAGNSVTGKYICNINNKLVGNRCKVEIPAKKLGDINNDNNVDSSDEALLIDYLNSSTIIDNSVADVTLDGKVDKSDLNKFRFYLAGIRTINEYVCPNNYELDNNKCIKYESAINVNNTYEVGTAVEYNNSYWYVISNKDDYVTLLKRDTIEDAINYNEISINNILNSYISGISSDLKEVNGTKIRLININDLKDLGFVDKTNTNYYEDTTNLYYLGYEKKEYWLDNGFIMVNYNGENYAYKATDDTLAYIRPVINVYKSKLK